MVPTMTVHQLSAMPSMILAATTPENTRIEPIEMSNPPPTITNVMPDGHDLQHRHVEGDVAEVGHRGEARRAAGSRTPRSAPAARTPCRTPTSTSPAATPDGAAGAWPRPPGRAGAGDRGVGVGARLAGVGPRAWLMTRPPRGDRRTAASSSRAPVIAPTSCSTVASAPVLGDAFAQTQHLDAVGHLEHLGHVVADQHDGDALVGDPAHQLEHLAGLAHAEGRRRLVHEDHLVAPTSPSGRWPRSASARPTARRRRRRGP